MFMIGVLCGIGVATAYVLYGDPDKLIELAEKVRVFARKMQEHGWGGTRG